MQLSSRCGGLSVQSLHRAKGTYLNTALRPCTGAFGFLAEGEKTCHNRLAREGLNYK